jgi:Tol biopolymer transport system component/DNA-binding winged helix-turn-helix (wHTH) protein
LNEPSQRARVVRFGVFEVDLRTAELRKQGVRIRLSGQSFQVLEALLLRPGELVTREELRQRLWPADSFGDFEHGLNAAVNRVRDALGDSSDNPRFVETLPRRGYRFIAPAEPIDSEAKSPPQTRPPASDTQPTPQAESARAPSRGRRRWVAMLTAAAILVLALAYFLRPELPPPRVTGVIKLTQDGVPKDIFVQGYHLPLLTDGSRLYFREITATLWPMAQVSAEGGEVVPIDNPFEHYDAEAMPPSGLDLLLGSDPVTREGVAQWLLPLPGSRQLRRIGKLQAWDATYSPDGSLLYYCAGTSRSDVFVANADGSNSRKLFTAPGPLYWLRVSPDGRLLRFSVNDPNSATGSLWEAHTDGTHLRRLLSGFSNAGDECCGNWTANGNYFVFQSTREELSTLWAIREKPGLWHKVNHDAVQITQGPMSATAPMPSKDGKKIFFIGLERRGEVMRYGLGTHTLTPFLPGLSAEGLTFTKDGTRMAYASYPQAALWQSRTDGSDRRQLTFWPMKVTNPRWSPDGSRIAFSASEPGKPTQIYLVHATGGDPEQLTSGDLDKMDVTWSADGNLLAYGASWAQADKFKVPIHILDLRTRLVSEVPNSMGFFAPRWSPDGRYLLAILRNGSIMMYDFTIHGWQELARNVIGGYASWSPDGRYVYFNAATLGQTDASSPEYRVCINDPKIERIADMAQAGKLAFGNAGYWSGLAPDGSILALRDVSVEEIYALDVQLP